MTGHCEQPRYDLATDMYYDCGNPGELRLDTHLLSWKGVMVYRMLCERCYDERLALWDPEEDDA